MRQFSSGSPTLPIPGRTLLITESGFVAGIGANNTATVLIYGDNSKITNRGTISTMSNGIRVGGDGASATTTIDNSGLIEAEDFAITHAQPSVASVALTNTGTIRADSTYYSFSASAKDLITNDGLMDGLIYLGGGDDLYDGRAGRVLGTVEGGVGNDTILGGVLGETLLGSSGDDFLDGGGGNDLLDGGFDGDTMLGGAGNDTYAVREAGDVVSESGGSGTDIVQSAISFDLSNAARSIGAIENLLLTGATALNGIGNAFNNVITGNDAVNILSGQNGNDSLVGNAGIDTLNGGLGNDVLDGGLDGDKMFGGAGNDTFVVGESGDIVSESGGSGIDRVQSTISFNLANTARAVGAIENLTLVNLATALNGTGNAFNNTIAGNSFANTLLGQNGNDNLIGNAGNDTLNGGLGKDFLSGGAGDDKLNGGLGIDTHTGGANKDIFIFNNAAGLANRDIVTDFSHVDDTFHLDNAVFAKLGAAGALNAAFFRAGAAAVDANDHVIYNKATGALSYDADGSGAGAAFQIAVITNKPVLQANDFVVI